MTAEILRWEYFSENAWTDVLVAGHYAHRVSVDVCYQSLQ